MNGRVSSMNIVIYILSLFIIACIILIGCILIFNRFQSYIIRINEAESNIDTTLRKRFDLLNKSIGIIKANADIKEDVLEVIVKLRSRKLTNFDLDRQLYEAINEFHLYKDQYESLRNCESFMKIDVALNESEAEIVAFRKYYNDIITDYNKMVRSFPSNIIAKVCHYKENPYYDGKDLTDDIKNDFKL